MTVGYETRPVALDHEAAKETRLLSILCPVHNEERAIPLFFDRIRPVLYKLSERFRVHLVFLNNASTHHSSQEILKMRENWPATFLISNEQECRVSRFPGVRTPERIRRPIRVD